MDFIKIKASKVFGTGTHTTYKSYTINLNHIEHVDLEMRLLFVLHMSSGTVFT